MEMPTAPSSGTTRPRPGWAASPWQRLSTRFKHRTAAADCPRRRAAPSPIPATSCRPLCEMSELAAVPLAGNGRSRTKRGAPALQIFRGSLANITRPEANGTGQCSGNAERAPDMPAPAPGFVLNIQLWSTLTDLWQSTHRATLHGPRTPSVRRFEVCAGQQVTQTPATFAESSQRSRMAAIGSRRAACLAG